MKTDDSSSLDPYRPPEAVQRFERSPDDPEWVGKPSNCKTCNVEFIVENKYRRDTCEDCDSRGTWRAGFILLGVFLIYVAINVLNVLLAIINA